MKERYAEALATVAANHRERRKDRHTTHKALTCADQPGLLGPKTPYVVKGLYKNCTELGWTTVLHRNEVSDTHSYVQAYFESIKGHGKKVTKVKEPYDIALATAAANHRCSNRSLCN